MKRWAPYLYASRVVNEKVGPPDRNRVCKHSYLCVHTADGIAHILARGDNHGEHEQDDAGDAPVQAEHCCRPLHNRRSKSPFVRRHFFKAHFKKTKKIKHRDQNIYVYVHLTKHAKVNKNVCPLAVCAMCIQLMGLYWRATVQCGGPK